MHHRVHHHPVEDAHHSQQRRPLLVGGDELGRRGDVELHIARDEDLRIRPASTGGEDLDLQPLVGEVAMVSRHVDAGERQGVDRLAHPHLDGGGGCLWRRRRRPGRRRAGRLSCARRRAPTGQHREEREPREQDSVTVATGGDHGVLPQRQTVPLSYHAGARQASPLGRGPFSALSIPFGDAGMAERPAGPGATGIYLRINWKGAAVPSARATTPRHQRRGGERRRPRRSIQGRRPRRAGAR